VKQIKLQPSGEVYEVKTNTALSTDILAEKLGLIMACGGHGLCATCHVFVKDGGDNLSPVSDREKKTLQRVTSCSPASRLACQARVHGPVEVSLPEGRYLESAEELESLIGRRAETNILHPVTGQVLVKQGQIISKFATRQLKGADFKPWEIASKTKTTGGKAV